MGHHHDSKGGKLLLTIFLNLLITAAEFAGGLISGSLALISDAFHNLSDALSLIISFFARKIGQKQADKKRTFGYKRAEILAALFNASLLFGMSLFLITEAYERFFQPLDVQTNIMLWVASIGLVANILSMLLLHSFKKGSLNIRSAYLHMLGDTLSSLAVIFGGLLMLFFDIHWIDPLITLLIALYLMWESWKIIRQSGNILLQSSPAGINLHTICKKIEQIPQIEGIHHVHIWQLDENEIHFEAHIDLREDLKVSELEPLKEKADAVLLNDFNIKHTTYQFEYNSKHPKEILNKD